MLLKPETLATLNRGRKLNIPLKIGNDVYSLFAACPTSQIPLPFTSKARFLPRHYKITGNNPRNVRYVSEQIYKRTGDFEAIPLLDFIQEQERHHPCLPWS